MYRDTYTVVINYLVASTSRYNMKIHRGNFESNLKFVRELIKRGILTKESKILEIGSGNGAFVYALSSQGYKITGSEINDTYIKAAKRLFGINLTYSKGEDLSAEIKDKYDVVLSFDVFEHIPDTDAHVKQVYSVLKKGGYYALVTPNKYTNIPYEILQNKDLFIWREYHCSLQTFGSLKKHLENNKFTATFVDIPIVSKYFISKVKKTIPFFSSLLLMIPWNTLPYFARTNFFVIAKKN